MNTPLKCPGVQPVTGSSSWQASFKVNKIKCYVGTFKTFDEARIAITEKRAEIKDKQKIRVDLTGKTFGRLVVIEVDSRDNRGRLRWSCLCDCGKQKVIDSRHLVQGKTVSCGCYSGELGAWWGKETAHKRSGSKSHLYNPNLTDEERLLGRNLVEVREWRKAVWERDDYTCDLCLKRGGSIVAHHLNCWSKFKGERFNVDNGITLCKICHNDFHNSLGGSIKPCNREQYINYKNDIRPSN